MSLSPGTRLGPYEILAPIGAGGMGEVYRAKDPRLGRDVAIKVLPASFSADADRLRRFEKEARAAGMLNHPNITSVFDIGEIDVGGAPYVVQELLEGQTLGRVLAGGSLSPRRAVDYGVQIANGLAAAHEKGIVHRDLKPENLFVTSDGRVKILDFGLARVGGAPFSHDTNSPTATGGTESGVVLGTVGYMSPEQVRGLAADTRSDLFSFGAVLYEMLSGKRAFQRDTPAETMTAILKDDPVELSATSSGSPIPVPLARIVQHCLEKNPQERFQSARDVAFDLANAAGASAEGVRGVRTTRRRPIVIGSALLAAGIVLGAIAGLRFGGKTAAEPIRVRALTFSGRDYDPTASPDGRLIAFTSSRDGVSKIWVKQLVGGGEAPLTSGPDRRARFSPDGSSILFVRSVGITQAVYRVGLVGGEPRKLIDDAVEADWSPDGKRIVFVRYRDFTSTGSSVGLGVFDTESARESVLLQAPAADLYCPRWSPDGRSIAYIDGNIQRNSPTWKLMSIDPLTRRASAFPRLLPGNPLGGIAWSGDGRELFFIESASLIGDTSGAGSRLLRYDTRTGKRTNLLWADGASQTPGSHAGVTYADIAAPGRIVFAQKLRRQNLREVTLGSEAAEPTALLTDGSSLDRQPTYSPDGKSILFSSNRNGNLDLWLLDRASGSLRQVTDDAAQDWDPAFTPDGKQILWSSDRGGHLEAWIANADGSSARQLTHDGLDAENPTMTRDGKWVVYWSGGGPRSGIWKIHPDGTGDTRLIASQSVATDVSPDGRYALFVDQDLPGSKDTIRFLEVESGRELPIRVTVPFRLGIASVIWGRARWSPDGKTIYFVGQDGTGRSGVFAQSFEPGRDTSASRRPVAGFSSEYETESLGLSPDGKRLTISTGQEVATVLLADGVPAALPPVRKAP